MNTAQTILVTSLSSAVLASGAAQATTTTINVDPTQVPDEMMPIVNTGDAPTGFGPDSWSDSATGKVNWHARYGADGDALSALFGPQAATLTISDIANISYQVNSTTEHWFLKVYTRPDGDNDQASWYGFSFTNNYGSIATDGIWVEWSTGAGGMLDLDERSGQGAGTNYMDWATFEATYGDELVEMISVQTNSGPGTAGAMDALVITLDNGDIGQVNFVPEPGSIALLGLGGLALIRRRRRA